VWHKISAGSNFCDFCGFFHDLQKKVPAKKIFSAKNNSTVEKIRNKNDEIAVGALFTIKISKEKDRLKVPHLLTD